MRRYAIGGVVIGALIILVGFIKIATTSSDRRTGSNNTSSKVFVVELPGGQQYCEDQQTVPSGTAALRVGMITRSGEQRPLELTLVNAEGKTVDTARAVPPFRNYIAKFTLAKGGRQSDVSVCIRNLSTRPVAFSGTKSEEKRPVDVGVTRRGPIQIEYLRAGKESWVALAPTIAERFATAKGKEFAPWMFWVAMVLLLAAYVLVAILFLWPTGGEK